MLRDIAISLFWGSVVVVPGGIFALIFYVCVSAILDRKKEKK